MKYPNLSILSFRLIAGVFALLAFVGVLPLRADPGAASGQPEHFNSPGEAAQALRAATASGDRTAVDAIFGSDVQQLLSGDPRQDALEFAAFAKSIGQFSRLVQKADDRYMLNIGAEDWPFPIPIVRKDGMWLFDAAAGKDEIINRRIGGDERTAIAVCRTYIEAQREYASKDRDGSGVLRYAQNLKSSPVKRDGLYWPASPNEDQSPFGPLVAEARAQGYGPSPDGAKPQPFHGYFFKILTAQGASAPGGAYNYVINGNLIGGFALVAYPAHWGESGVMTFIVNQWGKVYQRNLGETSAEVGAAMTEFDPDDNWTVVP